MIEDILVVLTGTIAMVVAVTLVYRLMPFRLVAEQKPALAFLPKYRMPLNLGLDAWQIEAELAGIGFELENADAERLLFVRGSLAGDLANRAPRTRLGVREAAEGGSEITLEATWIVGFDNGEFWTFITEVGQRLENPRDSVEPEAEPEPESAPGDAP